MNPTILKQRQDELGELIGLMGKEKHELLDQAANWLVTRDKSVYDDVNSGMVNVTLQYCCLKPLIELNNAKGIDSPAGMVKSFSYIEDEIMDNENKRNGLIATINWINDMAGNNPEGHEAEILAILGYYVHEEALKVFK